MAGGRRWKEGSWMREGQQQGGMYTGIGAQDVNTMQGSAHSLPMEEGSC
jgi:hypothetical protein